MSNIKQKDRIFWFAIAGIISLTAVPVLNNYSLLKLGDSNKALNEKTVGVVVQNNALLLSLINQTAQDTHLLRAETNQTIQSILHHDIDDRAKFTNVLNVIQNNTRDIHDITENLKLTKINYNRIYQTLNETHELINAVKNQSLILKHLLPENRTK